MNTTSEDNNTFRVRLIRQYLPIAIACISVCLMIYVFAMDNLKVYFFWFEGESSLSEIMTVITAFIGIAVAVRNYTFRSSVPSPYFGTWMVLFALGFLYIGMEEASWGQHVFGWQTPEWIASHNRQEETNIHNLFGKGIDRIPKAILGALVIVSGVFWPLYCRLKGTPKKLPGWFHVYWPTTAISTIAICFLAIWLIGRSFVISDQNNLEGWNLTFSEVRELFITYFLLVYVLEFKRFKSS